MGSHILGLCLGLCLSAQPASRPAGVDAVSSRPSDANANRVLSSAEAKAYSEELEQVAELYSLASFREGAKAGVEAAKREAAKVKRDADAKARTESLLRSRKTLTNWRRHPHHRRAVLSNHYQRMHAIDEQHRAEVGAAADKASEQVDANRDAARNITRAEKTTIVLAQVAVHAKYGQRRACLAGFAQGVSDMPGFFQILNKSRDSSFCVAAAGDLEESFAQALEALSAGEPRLGSMALAGQHAGLKLALERPEGRELAAYVGDAWRDLKENAELTDEQKPIAEYWVTESRKYQKADVAAAAPEPAQKKPGGRNKKGGGKQNRGK